MGIIPALLSSTSTRPKPSMAPWISASTSARFVTSVANPMALPPVAEISLTTASIRFERRAPSTTFAPRSARSFAVLSPMPLLAPVITTTLSVIFDVFILFFSLFKNLLFTAGCTPLNDGPRDSRNLLDQRGQEGRYIGASRKTGALPGPHRHEICPARSLCCDCEISDEFSLQGIR